MTMADVGLGVGAFGAGLVLWTMLEYGIHRFGGHARWMSKLVRREHMQHHATPDYFTSFARKMLLAVPVLGAAFALSAVVLGPALGASFVSGTMFGWWFYHQVHAATHLRGPRNRYGVWARRHHLHHHFQNAKRNHGVTSPVWDWVFGTLEQPSTIKVPRRQVHCFAWLLEGDEVRDEYAGTYRVV